MIEHDKIPTIALDSVGCKLNQAEIQQLAGELAAAGYQLVSPGEDADVYVLNTCTVTHVADRKVRQLLRQARRRNPGARIVAIGCYAERAADNLTGLADMVLDNTRKWELPRLLEDTGTGCPSNEESRLLKGGRTRSFVKVQEGCRNFCAYCIVPLVRSSVASVPADEVVERVRLLADSGCREVVLTGTEVGAYSHGDTVLKNLIEKVLTRTEIERLRLSSLQPPEITLELVGLWRDSRLCQHFHLSLQSGSDSVLRCMKRRYSTAEYKNAVSLIREKLPDVAVTTDVIVGFPGETDEEFAETMELCREMAFARIHVFPFSPRPGTEAACMPEQMPRKVIEERRKQMLALASDSLKEFHGRFMGRMMEVLFEQRSGGHWSGLTGNYIRVYVRCGEDLTNRSLPVRLNGIYRDGVLGEIV
jgi:threonylcarbamoyladenosine tRNA methylthiotransferase MtaB